MRARDKPVLDRLARRDAVPRDCGVPAKAEDRWQV